MARLRPVESQAQLLRLRREVAAGTMEMAKILDVPPEGARHGSEIVTIFRDRSPLAILSPRTFVHREPGPECSFRAPERGVRYAEEPDFKKRAEHDLDMYRRMRDAGLGDFMKFFDLED